MQKCLVVSIYCKIRVILFIIIIYYLFIMLGKSSMSKFDIV